MFGKRDTSGKVVAVADIESGSAGVVILETGDPPRLISLARENLPLEDRSKGALQASLIHALSAAGEKALAASTAAGVAAHRIAACYCVIGSPWSHSFSGVVRSDLGHDAMITDDMIAELAKRALVEQKDIDRADLLEANVLRVLLNGYPTSEPAGKRAASIDLFTLASDSDPAIKNGATEALARLFPGVQLVWRSTARAVLAVIKEIQPAETCLLVEMSAESTDLIVIRKGTLDRRILIEHGLRQTLSSLAKGKPVEETLSLMEMLEKDECESEACKALETSIAKAEPDLAHMFGEALAKLSTPRKLPNDLLLIGPSQLLPWLSRFFSRIDFTQFTATTRPFSVTVFSASELPGIPHNNSALFTDPGLSIACDLVNIEQAS